MIPFISSYLEPYTASFIASSIRSRSVGYYEPIVQMNYRSYFRCLRWLRFSLIILGIRAMVYSASLDFKLLRNDFTFDSGSAGPSEKKSDSNKVFTSYEREGISNSLSVN